jgi:hypothetical protein
VAPRRITTMLGISNPRLIQAFGAREIAAGSWCSTSRIPLGEAKYATFTEITPKTGAAFASQTDMVPAHVGLDLHSEGLVDYDVFSSIVTEGKLALLCAWRTAPVAKSWRPKTFEGVEALRHRVVRVVREYGMYDRREAPQYYDDVAKV